MGHGTAADANPKTPLSLLSSGDTTPNSEELSMVSPELLSPELRDDEESFDEDEGHEDEEWPILPFRLVRTADSVEDRPR